MKFDDTWTITAIIAVSSLLSPIFVAIINNLHHAKMRKIELEHDEHIRWLDLQQHLAIDQANIYYEDKKNAFSEFTESAGLYAMGKQSHSTYEKLIASIHKAMLFCNSTNYELLSDFCKYVDKIYGSGYTCNERNNYSDLLTSVTISLNKELASTKPIIQREQSKC